MNPSEKTLARLYRDEALYPVFQPIVDLRKGSIFGHEALIRGPLGTPFHTPAALLALAAEEDCLTEFELACVEVILRHWGRLTAPGQLFLNMSSDALAAAMEGPVPGRFERALALHGIAPRSVTVEITEDRPASHMGALRLAVKALHSTGARIALDDFGEGQSNLRLWSELRPDFVKIDKFFTHGIASSPHNLELVRTIVGFGHTLGLLPLFPGIALVESGAGCKAPVRSKASALQARATPQTAPDSANPSGRPVTAGHSALRSLRVRQHAQRHAP